MPTTEERLEALEEVAACLQHLFSKKIEAARQELPGQSRPPTAEATKQGRRK